MTDVDERVGDGDAARLSAEIAEAERLERLRLAEALHDDALQRLFAARQDLAEVSGATGDRRLEDVDAQLQELAASLRGLVTAMHDESIDAASLEDAVRRLGDDAARRGRIAVRTRVDPVATGGHDTFVVEVVRELLANVVRHAQARSASVEIDVDDDALCVVVRDDGRGLSRAELDAAAADGHLGHARLRRRLSAVGGSLELAAPSGGGTEVHVRVPVEALRAQRELEDELRRERGWSAALVGAIQDGFLVFRDGRVVQVNDRFCALTGHTREQVLDGDRGEEGFWPARERERLLAHVLRGRQRGGQEEVVLHRRDGSELVVLVAGRGIRDEAGRHAGMLVTVKDITTLHEAARQRSARLELEVTAAATMRLRELVEVAMAVHDQEGLEALLDTIGHTISTQLGWGAVVNLHRPAWDDFAVRGTYGMPDVARVALEGRTYRWSDWGMLQERFLRRGAYVIPAELGEALWGEMDGTWVSDVPADPDAPPDAWRPHDALLIPVRHTDGQWLGILSLDAPRSGRRPTDPELDVLTAAAGVVGIALQRATEAVDHAEHRAALEQLLRVSSRIAGARQLEPVLDKVVGAICDVLGFERVVVDIVDPLDGLLRCRAGRGLPEEAWPEDPVAPEELRAVFDIGFRVEGCYLLGREDVAERVPTARLELPPARRDGRGPHAWDGNRVVVPLYGPEHDLVGVVWVDEPADHLLPSAARLQALRAFANQASAALISAWAYERLQRTAGDTFVQLGNGRAFEREVARERTLAVRADSTAEVVLCEVLGLDLLDEPLAEEVLAELSGVFSEQLRTSDRAFRMAPGTYALLLPGAVGGEVEVVVDRLRLRLATLHPVLAIRTGRAKVDAASASPGEVIAAARRSLADATPA